MKCPNCGADNPDDSIFCGDCGAPVAGDVPEPEAPGLPVKAQGPVLCHRCGAENPAGAVFCSACRAVLGTASAAASSEPEPAPERQETPTLGGDPRAQLPTRCPSCGGPVYPGQSRCRRCGANPIAEAHFEAHMEPKDAHGPILDEERSISEMLRRPNLVDYLLEAFLGPLFRR